MDDSDLCAHIAMYAASLANSLATRFSCVDSINLLGLLHPDLLALGEACSKSSWCNVNAPVADRLTACMLEDLKTDWLMPCTDKCKQCIDNLRTSTLFQGGRQHSGGSCACLNAVCDRKSGLSAGDGHGALQVWSLHCSPGGFHRLQVWRTLCVI